MNDCPCCLPPWGLSYEAPQLGWVYSIGDDGMGANTIAVFDLFTGTFARNLYTLSAQCNDIVVDLDGNIYFANGHQVIAIAPDGSVRWTADHGGSLIRGLAATNNGYLYSAGNGPDRIRKWNTATGSEVTSSGWPYTPAIPTLGNVCVDQSGNVYATGYPTGDGNHVVSLDSTGSVRWSTSVASSTDLGRWCAVNEAGTELAVALGTPVLGAPGKAVVISASSGGVITSYNHVTANLWGCCYDSNGFPLFAGAPDANGYSVIKSRTPYKKDIGFFNFAIVAGSDGAEVVGWPLRRIDAGSPWALSDITGFGLEHWQGRIGALGRR